jgi:hypothetical protein
MSLPGRLIKAASQPASERADGVPRVAGVEEIGEGLPHVYQLMPGRADGLGVAESATFRRRPISRGQPWT